MLLRCAILYSMPTSKKVQPEVQLFGGWVPTTTTTRHSAMAIEGGGWSGCKHTNSFSFAPSQTGRRAAPGPRRPAILRSYSFAVIVYIQLPGVSAKCP
eukprot:scaffold10179_cov36-Tisochrysis_lutea.AAC.1